MGWVFRIAGAITLLVGGNSASAQQLRLVGPPPTAFDFRLLATHNAARSQLGIPPLVWDPALAAAAASYADYQSRTRHWGHSPRESRPGQSENLWMGTRGFYTPEQMVGAWVSERRYFRPGIFPNVTTTGNWADVGHYTQIIWRGTTKVGCALRSNGHDDYLVCRYSPKGNVDGRQVP